MDWWSAPCIGYLGFTGYHAAIDNYSAHFKVYPSVSKSNSHLILRRYQRDAAHDGITVNPGSVLYTDNEQIYNTIALEDDMDDNTMVHKFSAEYEP